MCGVAGIYNYGDRERPADRHLLARMTALLAHRGPDGAGLYVDGPLGLGHRRLAIVDPSPTGAQPMCDREHTCALSYNGEVYHHLALRPRLVARGARFTGPCDSETVLQLLRLEGPQALADAPGIFALAFWDRRARRLLLARDPLGVKQLYLHDDGRRLLFASEIKALLACPQVRRSIDPEALNEYVHFHTPLFARTLFAGITQLRPAEALSVTAAGATGRIYWHLDGFAAQTGHAASVRRYGTHPGATSSVEICATQPGDAAMQVAALRATLATVVADQLAADVPVGAFFSGGVDSSAIAALAARQGRALPLFGVHFAHPEVIDERPYQEATARALGLPLRLITVDASRLSADLPHLLYMQDQPVIGPAMLAMYHLSRLAAREVKVCLGGQGADEIFAGYARYALAAPLTASGGGGLLRGSLLKQLGSARNLGRLGRAALQPSAAGRYFSAMALVDQATWRTLTGATDWLSRRRARACFDAALRASPATHIGDRLLHWDMQTYLPGLFQQDDRMSMAAGIESRVPLADPRLVRLACRTPFALKMRRGCTKWVLRQAVADLLPARVLRRRKVGFDAPIGHWLRVAQRGFVHDVLGSATARERGLFCPRRVAALLARPTHPRFVDVTWKLLCIELWAQQLIDRAPAVAASAIAAPLQVAPARRAA